MADHEDDLTTIHEYARLMVEGVEWMAENLRARGDAYAAAVFDEAATCAKADLDRLPRPLTKRSMVDALTPLVALFEDTLCVHGMGDE